MDNHPIKLTPMARRDCSRRAMSLLELTIVVAIAGMLTVTSLSYFGHSAISNGSAEGFARKLSLALIHARRCTIATGENHYLQLTTSGGNVASYVLFRRTAGGDVQVDEIRTVPAGVTVTSGTTTLEFDFEGSALGSYSISVSGPERSWDVSTTILTGSAKVSETTP